MQNNGFDAVVVGGGAAGLFCAAQAARRGKRVMVLERTSKVGKKILMSGGGRCNFTNMDVSPENYLSNNPHFCKSALSRYTQWDFIALVAEYGIAYHEKKLGQLFCDNSAKDILNMLLTECAKAGVEIKTHCEITEINHDGVFRLKTNLGHFSADAVVIASGGLSIPSMGVTSLGYEVAEQFHMNVIPTRAALVPFTLGPPWKEVSNRLSGVSLETIVQNQRAAFKENILFTHRGLSGPAVLQISSYWQPGESVKINLLPNVNGIDWLLACKKDHPKSLLRTVLSQHLPKKLVAEIENIWWNDVAQLPIVEISHSRLTAIAEQITEWELKPSGTEGYRTAEVTMGGVDTNDLSSKTMESKTQPGLYFIGEVVDVTGHLGGYNFQWAWSSAYAAAQAL